MPAALYKITIEQGANFRLLVTWKDSTGTLVDLTGYTGKAEVRSGYGSSTVALDFTVALGGSAGTVLLTANAEATRNCSLQNNQGVWDLELTDSEGVVTRLLDGKVLLSREVTK